MRYIPNSPEERKEMLEAIGLKSAEELFDSIPQDLLLKRPLNTPAALSEIELLNRFEKMGKRNAAARRPSFLGGGAYSHYIPTIVDHIISRSEFFTAYTPFLKKNIGMAYVPVEHASVGQEIKIDVRGKLVGAQIVKTPFYKRIK